MMQATQFGPRSKKGSSNVHAFRDCEVASAFRGKGKMPLGKH